MTKEELAKELHGNEYTKEIAPALEGEAKMSGLVVVFGASDDLMEFRGAIHDEVGAWEGAKVWIVNGTLWEGHGCDSECKHARAADAEAKRRGRKIEAVWDKDGYSWVYKTDIPHATFDVMEGKEKYCRGIVFRLTSPG
jgi:hypothetical protein